MIKIYTGDDRVKIQEKIREHFHGEYEALDGAGIAYADMPSIFLGTSLFGDKRKILIKDLSENKEAWEKFTDYVGTEHDVVLWESKLDKRTATYKELVKKNVEVEEINVTVPVDTKKVFDIFNVAMTDGKKAVKMLEEIEDEQEPMMFVGLMVSQAIKKFQWKQGTKEKRVLMELSKLDIAMKTTSFQPWTLVKSFLLQVSSW